MGSILTSLSLGQAGTMGGSAGDVHGPPDLSHIYDPWGCPMSPPPEGSRLPFPVPPLQQKGKPGF